MDSASLSIKKEMKHIMNEYINLKVGTILSDRIGCYDGVQIDVNDMGVDILVCLSSPTDAEKNIFNDDCPFQMKLATEDNIIFFLLKFGNMPWMDAPYNINLSKNLTELPKIEDGMGLAARVYLIDTSTGKIEAIRLLGLSTNISRMLIRLIEEQRNMPFNISEYVNKIREIYSKKPTKQLVKEGLGCCKL